MVRLVKKSGFLSQDKVYFDDFKKEGIVTAINGDRIRIFDIKTKSLSFRHPQTIYKKSETMGCGHWDALSKEIRLKLLVKYKAAKKLSMRDWNFIPGAIKQALYKGEGSGQIAPQGINTDTQNIYNPVSSDKTVTDRIKEELEEQSKDDSKDNSKDDKKDKKKGKKNKNKKNNNFINRG